VAGQDRSWGFIAGLAGTAGLGLVVYLSLSAGRHARAQSTIPPASPIPTVMAQAAPPPPPPQPAPPPQVPPPLSAPTVADESARLRAPSMVVDLSDAPETAAAQTGQGDANAPAAAGSGAPAQRGKHTADERFASRVAGAQVDTAHATRLADPALVTPQGTVISAVLETGINSDLPGFVRAVVSRDVSGFDGSTVLIPRGSKLFGEYKSAMAVGQSRAFVIWTRLLTPDGVSINLESPAADRLGRGGLDGKANSHFVQRFGSAILLSVISAGLQALVNQASPNTVNAVIIGSPQQATNVASVALQKEIDIPTTITVPQGQAIRVFVSRDLDFSDVMQGR
jgi:type IV secretion system protein VirB10